MKQKELEEKRKRLGNLLRSQRQLLKISKVEMSKMSGLSRVTIDKLENGYNVAIDSVIIFNEVIGKDIYFLECGQMPNFI